MAAGKDYALKLVSFIMDLVDECPNENYKLTQLITSKQTTGTLRLRFVEEVKDGRSSKFQVIKILQLKGKKVALIDVVLTINNISFDNQQNQESESDSKYIDYYFNTSISIEYPNSVA